MKKFSFALFFLFVTAFCLSAFAQNYSIERYLNIRSAGSPEFSPDGKRIAFLTNITGTSQIWFVDSNGGYPEQITSFDDNISFVEWLPDKKGLIFGKAIGGNENTQFFRLSDDGADIKQLTTDEKTRHNFGAISKTAVRFFTLQTNAIKIGLTFTKWKLRAAKKKCFCRTTVQILSRRFPMTVNRVVVSRSSVRFSLDNDLYLIDAKTKAVKHLTPHDEATQYGDVHFLPDNKTLVFGTNDKREFYNLAEMSLKGDGYPTAAEIADKVRVIDNTNWDLDASRVSPHGDYFAYTTNREGFSELFYAKSKPAENL